MNDLPQTMFGLMLPVSSRPVAPDLARALAERISATAQSVQAGAPAASAAGARREAEHYLSARRRRELRLPAALELACDANARAVMRATVGVPPLPNYDRLVA
ncbi:MAG: hypothetical protein JO180_07305 [Gemmatirosa sp.]|nr:hypothetical protein [Gemmatirosa sp.]